MVSAGGPRAHMVGIFFLGRGGSSSGAVAVAVTVAVAVPISANFPVIVLVEFRVVILWIVVLVHNNDFRASAGPMCEPETATENENGGKKDQNDDKKHVCCGHAVVRGALYRQISDLPGRCNHRPSSGSSVPIFENVRYGNGCPPEKCGRIVGTGTGCPKLFGCGCIVGGMLYEPLDELPRD